MLCCSSRSWRLLSAAATHDAWRTKPLYHGRMRSSEVDYHQVSSNVLYCGITDGLSSRLQSVQIPEYRCSSRYRFRTAGTNNTYPAAAPLAAAGHVSLLCFSWRRWSTARLQELHRPTNVRLVLTYITCWSALSALSWLRDMCTSSHTQRLRLLFRHCGTN